MPSSATSMPPDGRRLLIDLDAAAKLRREVGPVGWVVLEVMASSTTPASPEAVCSARSLAEAVGVSRDTVARALRHLIQLRLVVRIERRDELTGRFGTSSYRLELVAVGIRVVNASPGEGSPQQRAFEPKPKVTIDQLTLIQ
jgi:DNA-binding transcriptional MocR family regulator